MLRYFIRNQLTFSATRRQLTAFTKHDLTQAKRGCTFYRGLMFWIAAVLDFAYTTSGVVSGAVWRALQALLLPAAEDIEC